MTIYVVRRELELNRLQSDFVAGVTHEFKSRSPVSGCSSNGWRVDGCGQPRPRASITTPSIVKRTA